MPELQSGLRILFVGTLPPHQGGSGVMNGQVLAGLSARGHQVQALAPITAEVLSRGDPFAAAHHDLAVARYLIPHWEVSLGTSEADEYRTLESEHIRKDLPALIAGHRPDVVIMGRESFALHVPDLAKARGLPCVLFVHGGTTLGVLKTSPHEALSRKLLAQFRKADLLIAVAEHLARELGRLGLERIKVIPNAIDVDRFSPRPRPLPLLEKLAIADDDVVVMHLSNLKPLKRPFDLLHSARQAVPRNSKLIYVIVGNGPLRLALKEACCQAHLAKRFRFVDWVDHHRLPDYLNLADLVVLPSEAEGQALVWLETQACGRLLLASDIPGAREVIRDGETGLLFRKGDVEDLTTKTLLAAGDPGLRAEIGRKAREQVQSRSLGATVAAYGMALEQLVRQHRR